MTEFEPRNFVQACLLLLLCEKPDHGYELAARLHPLHDADGDAGVIYRALRALERQSLVRSEWQRSATGPDRRTYHVTPAGRTALDAAAEGLQRTHDALHLFLDRYAGLAAVDTAVVRVAKEEDSRTVSRPHGGLRPADDANGRFG